MFTTKKYGVLQIHVYADTHPEGEGDWESEYLLQELVLQKFQVASIATRLLSNAPLSIREASSTLVIALR